MFVPMVALLLSVSSLPGQSVPERVYEKLLAPCCWHESLTVHRSETAVALRGEIAAMAKSGMTEDQITNQLVQRYGVRILRVPPGKRATWLFVMPVIAVILGAFVLMWFVRRNLRRDSVAAVAAQS